MPTIGSSYETIATDKNVENVIAELKITFP